MPKSILFKCDRVGCTYSLESQYSSLPDGWSKNASHITGILRNSGRIEHYEWFVCPSCTSALKASLCLHPLQ